MKHFILWGLTLAAVVLGGCSDDYDDTELRTGLNDLRDRVAKLETQLTKLNGEITTIDALVRKLESNVSVVKVEPGTDGKSYTIYFSDDTKAVIANGEDGVAGKDAPVIGVKEEDGVYYWAQTIDGKTTILEVDGQKLRVTAEVTPPRLSVDEEGYWEASYDGGDTWDRITGEGRDGRRIVDSGLVFQRRDAGRRQRLFHADRRVGHHGREADGFLPDPAQGSRCGTLRLRRDQDL